MPPTEIGCLGMMCWCGLRNWQAAGLWARLHRILLERRADADKLALTWTALDFSRIAAKKGGAATDPNPTDRVKSGTKRHVVASQKGTLLDTCLSGTSRYDSLVLAPNLDAVALV
jgi:hypothetical protein